MSDTCISEVAFKSLPQAVRTWIKELGWEREDIYSYHVVHDYPNKPKVVTLTNMQQEKQIAQFGLLVSGKWKRKVVKVK